jgi:hypothetical protein
MLNGFFVGNVIARQEPGDYNCYRAGGFGSLKTTLFLSSALQGS